MATSKQVNDYRQAQRDVAALAYQEVLAFWRTLDTSNADETMRALRLFLPSVINDYGDLGATIAADFYADLRADNPNVRRPFAGLISDPIPAAQIQGALGYAGSPYFVEKPKVDASDVVLAKVFEVTNRLVLGAGRATIAANVAADPDKPRYARVPTGTSTCAWCLMLASRGAVYASGDASHHKFHGHCDCVPTPVWEGDSLPDGYDPAALAATYAQAKADSNGSLKGPEGVLNTLRKQLAEQ